MNGFFRDENSYVILSTLSIPLNGFLHDNTPFRFIAEMFLSIPLNGFLEIGTTTVPSTSLFQFH